MHTYICDPSDIAAIAAFRQALQSLGTETLGEFDSSLGVRLVKLRIGQEILSIFNDTWSLDIDGPEQLVQRVLSTVAEAKQALGTV